MNTPPKSPQPKTPRNILYAVRASALGAFVSILITPPFVFGEDLFGKHTTLFGLGILLVASLQLILLSRHAAWKFLQPLARIAQNKWVMLFGNIPVLLTSVASIIIAFIFSKLILGTFMMMLIIGGVCYPYPARADRNTRKNTQSTKMGGHIKHHRVCHDRNFCIRICGT